jgi:hypothetical protein
MPTTEKENVMKKVFIAFVALAIASLACGMPDINSIINPLPKDDFSDSTSGWGTGTDTQSSVEYANGGLQFLVYSPYFITWSTPDVLTYKVSHVEVNVTNNSADPEAFFGIVCHALGSSSMFYYVGVSSDGYYAFVKSAVAQDDVTLKKGTSDLIKNSASPMKLGLECGNGSLTLFVNGQQVDTVSDSTYTSGAVGLFAASDDQDSGVDVTFDDFVMTKAEK